MTPDRATLEAALDDAILRLLLEHGGAFDKQSYEPAVSDYNDMRAVLVDRLVEALRPTGDEPHQYDDDGICPCGAVSADESYKTIPCTAPGAPAPSPTPETPKQA